MKAFAVHRGYTCTQCGKSTGDTAFAENADAVIAGGGKCEKCAFPKKKPVQAKKAQSKKGETS